MQLTALLPALLFAGKTVAVNSGASPNNSIRYSSRAATSSLPLGVDTTGLRGASYQYTGMGAAESNVDFAVDGSLIYSLAITSEGIGYATSKDSGETWTQVLPGRSAQPRPQPIFRKRASDGRYFYWPTQGPGLYFSYSDDQGATWTNLNNTHFDYLIQDWAKLVGGKPVHSSLSNGAKEILYLSAPSLISTPIPLQPSGPINQYIIKSTDRGNTWTIAKGMPTLQPLLAGGNCGTLDLLRSYGGQELVIWGDGFVRPNGTVMYELRRCRALSLAISDDEGDSWRYVDVPGSSLPPFVLGDLTYLLNGNVLVPEPISQDIAGNIYAIWVDENYVLKMSRSTDSAVTWTFPVVIGAPGNGTNFNTMAYLSTLTQHPYQLNRAVLAYYGSADGGKTYQAYVAETANLDAANPTWTNIIGNAGDQPMQANMDEVWDQGYGDPLYDLVEFSDVKWTPDGRNWVASFARRMCSAQSVPPQLYDAASCVDGWDFNAHAMSEWQGFLVSSSHSF
jgi:hypothetical protein